MRKRAEDGQNELRIPHVSHVCGEKQSFNAERFQFADVLQQVNGITGKPGDVLDQYLFEQAAFSVLHEPQKLFSVLRFCAGDSFVRIEPYQGITVFSRILGKKVLLCLQRVQLVEFVGGDPAISGNVDENTSILTAPAPSRSADPRDLPEITGCSAGRRPGAGCPGKT